MDHSDDTERRLSALERHVQALTQSQLNLQPATLTAATDPMETATSSLGLDVHTALLANAPGATAATPGGTAETEGRTELRAEVWRQDPGVMAQLKQLDRDFMSLINSVTPEQREFVATETLRFLSKSAGVQPPVKIDVLAAQVNKSGHQSSRPKTAKSATKTQKDKPLKAFLDDVNTDKGDQGVVKGDQAGRAEGFTTAVKRAPLPFADFEFDAQNGRDDLITLRQLFLEECEKTLVDTTKDGVLQRLRIHGESILTMRDILFARLIGSLAITQCKKTIKLQSRHANGPTLFGNKAKILSSATDEPEALKAVYLAIGRIPNAKPRTETRDFEFVCAWLEIFEAFTEATRLLNQNNVVVTDRIYEIITQQEETGPASTLLIDFLCHPEVLQIHRGVLKNNLEKSKHVKAFVDAFGRGVLVVLTVDIINTSREIGLHATVAMLQKFVETFPDVKKAFHILETGCYNLLLDPDTLDQLPKPANMTFKRNSYYVRQLASMFNVPEKSLTIRATATGGRSATDAIILSDSGDRDSEENDGKASKKESGEDDERQNDDDNDGCHDADMWDQYMADTPRQTRANRKKRPFVKLEDSDGSDGD